MTDEPPDGDAAAAIGGLILGVEAAPVALMHDLDQSGALPLATSRAALAAAEARVASNPAARTVLQQLQRALAPRATRH